MRRDETFNIRRLEAWEIAHPKYKVLKVPWDRRIVSPSGAQYHCWIPRSLSKDRHDWLKELFEQAAHYTGDVVECTWDYVPLDVRLAKCLFCSSREFSDDALPHFVAALDKLEDEYYCGCYGFD